MDSVSLLVVAISRYCWVEVARVAVFGLTVIEQQGQGSEELVALADLCVAGALRWGAPVHHGRTRSLGRMQLLRGEECPHARIRALTLGIRLLPRWLCRLQGIAHVGSSLKMMIIKMNPPQVYMCSPS